MNFPPQGRPRPLAPPFPACASDAIPPAGADAKGRSSPPARPKDFAGSRRPLPRARLRSATTGGNDPRLRTWSTTPIMSSDDSQVASSAPGVPALQLKQHRPQQGVVGRAGDEGSFGNPADECWPVAPLRWQVPLLISLKTVPFPSSMRSGRSSTERFCCRCRFRAPLLALRTPPLDRPR
jgi:hypothetical protein